MHATNILGNNVEETFFCSHKFLIHPAFIGISAFVGAGLVFAGITDSCGMGMMLAKMPWNQISQECKNGQRSD